MHGSASGVVYQGGAAAGSSELIDQPGPWGQSYRRGLDPRWGEEWAWLTSQPWFEEALPYLWTYSRDVYDQGAREQDNDLDTLPVNPYGGEPPRRHP